MKIKLTLLGLVMCVVFSACSKGETDGASEQSITQIYKEEGYPVRIRALEPENFAVYLKFPAEFKARTQSTAYAKISEVVREIRFTVGDYVKRDQVVLSFSQDNSAYQQAKLSFENAQSAYDRTKKLYADAGVSQQEYDNARTQYELAREAFKSAGKMVEVEAPISGFITQIDVRESANVSPGDPLFTVSNLDGYEATFYVTPVDIDQIKAGAKAVIATQIETLTGHISEVALNMDLRKKAFLVKASFDGQPKSLVSGMSVDISVQTYTTDKAIVVRRSEIKHSGGEWFAFVADGNKAVRRKLTIGHERNLELEVIDGLSPGDLFVSEGGDKLTDGALLKIIDADESK
ncbi:efflux RND transporter periplasmic adaptor subunit [Sediminispirochaeta bajacaliforniensis]|uniref:efflux RND transporter periplasmic adaptor subunit n=1 Tax=Sediminispirochaeta bajacaliforniensis TaxID=148 RepID=UPI000368703B|nr:efflux RND transporter periplasmic adaptor subunit [Sediminispirochaeta bajacaliforniensis]